MGSIPMIPAMRYLIIILLGVCISATPPQTVCRMTDGHSTYSVSISTDCISIYQFGGGICENLYVKRFNDSHFYLGNGNVIKTMFNNNRLLQLQYGELKLKRKCDD